MTSSSLPLADCSEYTTKNSGTGFATGYSITKLRVTMLNFLPLEKLAP